MSTAPDLTRSTANQGMAHILDARALNQQQTRLIFDASPEVDSLGELPAVLLRAGAPTHLVALMVRLCRQLLEANVAEGHAEMAVAGLLEEHLGRARLPLEGRVTGKQIAARLRGPLAVILDPGAHDGVAFFVACGAVRDEIRGCPRDQLLSGVVRHELRGRKFSKLTELIDATS